MPYIKEASYASVQVALHGYHEKNGKREPYSYPVDFVAVGATTQTKAVRINTDADFVCEKITHSCIGGATAAIKFGAGLKVQIKDTENVHMFQQEMDLVNISAPAPIGSGLPVLLPMAKKLAQGGQFEVAIRLA